MKVAVDLVVGRLSDERTVFREDLVAWRMASEFVEPIAARECVFPYLRTTESLEVLDPQFSVKLYHARIGRHSCDVGPRQCDEPLTFLAFGESSQGTLGSLPASVIVVAFFAPFGVEGLPLYPLP